MLVATVSTDDEAFHGFKVQVRNHRRHAVLKLENVSEDATSTGIVSFGVFLSILTGSTALLSKHGEQFSLLPSLGLCMRELTETC